MNPHRFSLAVLAGTGDENDAVFNLHRGEFHGTAFCLAPNLFITAAHVYEAAVLLVRSLLVGLDHQAYRCSWSVMPRFSRMSTLP